MTSNVSRLNTEIQNHSEIQITWKSLNVIVDEIEGRNIDTIIQAKTIQYNENYEFC